MTHKKVVPIAPIMDVLSAGKNFADNVRKTLAAMQVESDRDYFSAADIATEMSLRIAQRHLTDEELLDVTNNVTNRLATNIKVPSMKPGDVHQRVHRSKDKVDSPATKAIYGKDRHMSYGYRVGPVIAKTILTPITETQAEDLGGVVGKARSIMDLIGGRNVPNFPGPFSKSKPNDWHNMAETENQTLSDTPVEHSHTFDDLTKETKPEYKGLSDIKHSLKFLDSDQLLEVLGEIHYQLRTRIGK